MAFGGVKESFISLKLKSNLIYKHCGQIFHKTIQEHNDFALDDKLTVNSSMMT
uniref:Uncharacterized protein n=1 Tax=Romanomermis culicivorax TaxID=13658 RepID=A0A915HZE9_ROMCU